MDGLTEIEVAYSDVGVIAPRQAVESDGCWANWTQV